VIVVDSSVWIAHFRNLASRQVVLLCALFGREELLVGDIIPLEVLRGARDERNAVRLSRSMHARL
jgi:predicted nucleic acid-binding protein